jgi:DNA-binding transcriptional LysR family regulator
MVTLNQNDLLKTTKNDTDEPLSSARVAWDLDWNLLRTFMVIAQEKSITKAARILNLKQPSVSNALRRLETQLGCQLAERGPRHFIMTHHGMSLYIECKDLFGTIGRLPNIVQETDKNVVGHIKIVMASHVTSPILDNTLREFHLKNPQATFSLSVHSSHDVVEEIQEKKASLGICLIREQVSNIESNLFYREHFDFYCGANHPLFGQKNLTLADLRGQERVTFYTERLGDVLHPLAVRSGQAQLSDRVSGISNNLEEVRRMIMSGLGIGPLPIHVVERDVQNGHLWRLLPNEDPVSIDVFTIRNPKVIMNAAEKEFINLLEYNIKQTPLSQRIYGLYP